LNANLRFDDAARNLEEAAALQPCSVGEYGLIKEIYLDGDKKDRIAIPAGHQPDGGPINRRYRSNARQSALVQKDHKENIAQELARPRWARAFSFVPSLA
jgi:hypothetical protein